MAVPPIIAQGCLSPSPTLPPAGQNYLPGESLCASADLQVFGVRSTGAFAGDIIQQCFVSDRRFFFETGSKLDIYIPIYSREGL